MSAAKILTTERLVLRPVTAADLDEAAAGLFPLYSDPETMRFMPSLPHDNVAVTRNLLQLDICRPGAVYWNVFLQGRPEPVGSVNYLGETRLPGMGYVIRRDFWGQGLATEACRAALEYGFAHLGYDRVELWINELNFASQRVAQKLHFRLKGRLPQKYAYEANHHIMLVYGMWAHEWRGEPQPAGPRFFNVQPVLNVHDVAATVAFYRDKLGFGVDFLYGHPPEHAGVSRGDWTGGMAVLQLSQVPAEQAIQPAGYLYFLVDTLLDELYESYAVQGVEIVHTPQSFPWGLREFAVRDPNGHILRFGTQV